jgi:hypothetical protein
MFDEVIARDGGARPVEHSKGDSVLVSIGYGDVDI